MHDKINVGVIGAGSISDLHINGYLQNPDVRLYALCDIDSELLEKKALKYNIDKKYTDYNEMLKLKELDAVSVCTWNSMHAPCTIAALNAGKHVLCEKPMSVSARDAQLMKDAADKNKKLLMIGFVRRFGNDCEILKDFIESDFFGDIYYTKATYIRKIGNPGGWFGDVKRSGGGPLIDLGVHVIDLVRYLLGNPRPVSVYGATFDKLGDRKNIKGKRVYKSAGSSDNDICSVEDLATAMIRFDNGTVLSVETSFSLHTKNDEGKIELFGTKGGARLNPELELYTEANNYLADISLDADTALSVDGLFSNEINHFVSCIKNEARCISPADDGIEIMKILDAIYESAKTCREVIL